MAERYYWPNDRLHFPAIESGTMAELSGDEAHHLIRVMRRKPGDIITLFDGYGHEFPAKITGTQKDCVLLRILEVRNVDTESQHQVTVAVSLPKGDRQKWLLEKLTEIGCHRLIPLQTERGVAQCSDQVLERLRRQVVEATRQCHRACLMPISPKRTIASCVAEYRHDHAAGWIAHPRSANDFRQCDLSCLMQMSLPQRVLILIGPEGGFTRQEVDQAIEFGAQPLDLGPRILRVETAAILLTAILTTIP